MSFDPDPDQWADFRRQMRSPVHRFWRALTFRPVAGDRIDHAWVNLFVEGARADAYIFGHLMAWAATAVVAVGVVSMALRALT